MSQKGSDTGYYSSPDDKARRSSADFYLLANINKARLLEVPPEHVRSSILPSGFFCNTSQVHHMKRGPFVLTR
jgi:hypothetical protein